MAIQEAMDAAAEGDKVYLPAGTYRISKFLAPKSATKIIGAGANSTTILYVGDTPHSLLSITKAKNVEVANLTLDGGGSKTPSEDGIKAELSSDLYIHDIAVRNLGSHHDGDGIQLAQKVTDSRFENCTFSNIGVGDKWSSGFRISHGSSRNRIIGNTIDQTGRGGILCNDGCNDLIIQKNKITGSGGENLGIELWGGVPCDRAIVEDNQVDHWLSISGSNFAAVRRNQIAADDGIIGLTAIECVATHDSIFTDNIATGGFTDGVSISAGPEQYDFFAYNSFSNSTLWGMQIQGDAGGARNLYFYKDTYAATKTGPHTPLDTGYGIRINGNTHFLTLDSVTIKDNPSWAIQGIGVGSNVDGLSVVNCILSNNRSNYSWAGSMKNIEWENNSVSAFATNSVPSNSGFTDAKPVAVIECPDKAEVGEPVTFTSKSTDSDGTIAHTLWDLGVGAPIAESAASYTFTKAGSYRISLLVWDEAGRGGHAEKTIEISLRASAQTN